ncbi:MAG TPA: hypothetical protein VN494_00005 [Patescibacteria group bacterium]|nr:hypothetical protein [Patescibacteria group bacterium]
MLPSNIGGGCDHAHYQTDHSLASRRPSAGDATGLAQEESRTWSELIRDALRQYLASCRWQRLRQWGAETAERLGLKTEADLQRLLDEVRAGRRKTKG